MLFIHGKTGPLIKEWNNDLKNKTRTDIIIKSDSYTSEYFESKLNGKS
jgi:hypothetical protein